MKKMFVLFAAVVIAAGTWASPSPAENAKATAAFEKEFAGATDPQWSSVEDLYIVTFKLNNETMRAWYTEDGEFKAVQRYVKPRQMTLLAAKKLEELSTQAKIVSVEEVSKEGVFYYLVKTENEKAKITYSLSSTGEALKLEKKKKR